MKKFLGGILTILLLVGCQNQKYEFLAYNSSRGVDPILKPRGLTYTDIRQHTFSRAGGDYDPCISPDGKYLVFASTRHSIHPDIYIKKVNGNAVTRKTIDPASDIQPVFSPDGKKIAFASNRNGNWDIFIIKTFGKSVPVQITRSPQDDIHPSWSPDGKKLVYCSFSEISNQWEIWIVDLERKIHTVIGVGLFPVWSPKGNLIAFQKARQRDTRWYSIWTMTPDGENVTEVIADNDWAAINPSFSFDGNKIVFATVFKSPVAKKENRFNDGDDIWMVNIDGSNLVRLTTNEKPDWDPCWGPDGRVYFCSLRNSYCNIWSVKPIEFDLGK